MSSERTEDVEQSPEDLARAGACNNHAVSVDLSGESSESFNAPTSSESPNCRICFRGGSIECLLDPCLCRGSIGFVHQKCLERWLEVRNSDCCDICKHRFNITRRPKRFWEWFQDPSSRRDRNHLMAYCIWTVLSTPMMINFCWSCMQTALEYDNVQSLMWDAAALAALATIAAMAQVAWMVISVKLCYQILMRWRTSNHIIRLVPSDTSEMNQSELNSSTDSSSAVVEISGSSSNQTDVQNNTDDKTPLISHPV